MLTRNSFSAIARLALLIAALVQFCAVAQAASPTQPAEPSQHGGVAAACVSAHTQSPGGCDQQQVASSKVCVAPPIAAPHSAFSFVNPVAIAERLVFVLAHEETATSRAFRMPLPLARDGGPSLSVLFCTFQI